MFVFRHFYIKSYSHRFLKSIYMRRTRRQVTGRQATGRVRERGKRVERWCFTLNNPGNFVPPSLDCVAYMVFQEEVAPATGTEHLQGYVRFKMRKDLSAVKKVWGGTPMEGAHWCVSEGTEEQNRHYCTKEESRKPGTEPVEYNPEKYEGEAGRKGRRSDLIAVAKMVNEGQSMRSIAEKFPVDWMRYHRGIASYANTTMIPEGIQTAVRDMAVMVIWGPTNTGKTHRVFEMANVPFYSVSPGRDPWGAYKYEKMVLFDEFTPQKWDIREMNRICQKWPCKLDCRYEDKYLAATRIVITANTHPKEWYFHETAAIQNAFFRRIDECYHVTRRTSDPEWVQEQSEKIELFPE